MLELKFEGKVVCENLNQGIWVLENETSHLTGDILQGIDELLYLNKKEILKDDEEVEIIIRIKGRQHYEKTMSRRRE